MIRGTTPTIVMEIPEEIPVSVIEEAVFSISQDGYEVIQKRLADLDVDTENNAFRMRLTQEETYKLKGQTMTAMQLKIKIGNDVATSEIVSKYTRDVLNEDVI